ncbi:MAG: helix-turn-helix domain-containing protein [Pseudomonadota bacterium]
MKSRDAQILDAALQVFLRYGVKRASMGDIAAEAGVSRQTLYKFYTNKDDILRGSIRAYGQASVAAIAADMPAQLDLGGQIDLVFREMAVKPFEFLGLSPHAHDLIEGFNDAGRSEMDALRGEYQAVLENVLAPHAAALATRGLRPVQLAEILARFAYSAKHQARDAAHLTDLLRGIRDMAVTSAGVARAPTHVAEAAR